MKLGAKILKLREMHELTQAKLADRANVTQAYVARIESDRVENPKALGLAGLAKALGVPLEVLLDDNLSIEAWLNEVSSIRIDNEDRQLLRIYRGLKTKEKKLLL